MANLFKAYSNDYEKYSGATTDNFERKFMLFHERCDQGGIPELDRHRAFSIMLIGNVRQYYFDSLKSKKMSLLELENAVKSRFKTAERTRSFLREWESLTLNGIIASNSSKSPSAGLEILIQKLSDIQTLLPTEYRNEIILRNKILNSVRDSEACRLAYHKPAESVQGVISDLHASLATVQKQNPEEGPSTHLVDRRYHADGHRNYRGSKQQKKRFVCKRPGCWSTNHSTKQRLKAYRQNKSLQQFITTLGPDENSDDDEREAADAIEDIMIHITELGNTEDDDDGQKGDESFSYIAQIDYNELSAAFTAQLNDAIVTHTLTSQVPQTRFGGNLKGIMIDTGAARGSCTGKAQFDAYCKATGTKICLEKTRAAECHFGIGSATSIGIARITFPLGPLWLSFEAHVLDTNTPIIMSIDNMDCLGLYLNNSKHALIHEQSGLKTKIRRVGGHQFLQWNSSLSCFLTELELRRLHHRFGHPSTDKWEGPYSLLDINGEDIIILLPNGPTKFRNTVVKPFLTPQSDSNSDPTIHLASFNQKLYEKPQTIPVTNSNLSESNNSNQFEATRNKEFNNLIERGVFSLVQKSMANGFCIYGSRFVDEIKNEGKPSAYPKSRLVVHAYNDSNHGLLTHAPTVQRVSQRLLLTIVAMDSDLTFFTRDISQAYVQSDTSTQCPIFVRPPSSLQIPPQTIL